MNLGKITGLFLLAVACSFLEGNTSYGDDASECIDIYGSHTIALAGTPCPLINWSALIDRGALENEKACRRHRLPNSDKVIEGNCTGNKKFEAMIFRLKTIPNNGEFATCMENLTCTERQITLFEFGGPERLEKEERAEKEAADLQKAEAICARHAVVAPTGTFSLTTTPQYAPPWLGPCRAIDARIADHKAEEKKKQDALDEQDLHFVNQVAGAIRR